MMAQKERWEEELGLLREQLQREAASAQEDNQRQIQRLRHLCSRLPLSVAPELHSLHQDRVRLSEEVAMLQSAMRQMVNEAGRKVGPSCACPEGSKVKVNGFCSPGLLRHCHSERA